jgi:hypothetical protein
MVKVPDYTSSGSIPDATGFSEKYWGLEQGPPSLVRIIEELL